MGVGIENICELPWMRAARPFGGHTSIELNDFCPMEKHCRDDCFLIARDAPRGVRPAEEWVLDAFDEILDAGERVRHFGLPGMEPLASPGLMFEMLKRFHARPARLRPLTFNVISSGFRLDRYINRFADTPMTSLIISVDDAPSTGLRVVGVGDRALHNGLQLRERGGTKYLAANSVLTSDNSDAVLRIGGALAEADLDQWLVGRKTRAVAGRLVSELSDQDMVEFAYRAADELSGRGLHILVQVDSHATIARLPGGSEALTDQMDEWRISLPISDEVDLICWNSSPRFLRVRGGDSAIMTHDEFLRVGLRETVAGRYEPGAIKRLIGSWPERTRREFSEIVHA